MTDEEISEIEKVFKKPISEIEEIDIPAYIRKRDFEKEQELADATKYGETLKLADLTKEN